MNLRLAVRGLACCLAAAAGIAVTSSSPCSADGEADGALRPGAWSIFFQGSLFGGRNDFGRVDVSVKRHLTGRSAVRLNLNIGVSSSESGEVRTYEAPDTRRGGRWTDSDGRSYGIAPAYVFYPRPSPKVNFFLAAGPFVQWGSDDSSSEEVFPDQDGRSVYRRRSERDSRSVGGIAELGFEWFLTRRVGLVSTTGFTVSHTRDENASTDEREDSDPRESYVSSSVGETSSIRFGTTSLGLGFSVYF